MYHSCTIHMIYACMYITYSFHFTMDVCQPTLLIDILTYKVMTRLCQFIFLLFMKALQPRIYPVVPFQSFPIRGEQCAITRK